MLDEGSNTVQQLHFRYVPAAGSHVFIALEIRRRVSGRKSGSWVFFFQAEDGIRYLTVTGVQTCALPISPATKQAGIPPLVRAHGEAIRVMMAAQTERAIAAWPKDAARLVVVRAVAEREATFAVDGAERYLDAGYQKTRAALA